MQIKDRSREIDRLNAEVVVLHASLRFREASALAGQAVALARESPQDMRLEQLAPSLRNLAGVLSELGDYEEARALYDEALEIYTHSTPILPFQIAQTINGFGNLAEAAGEYSAAVDYYRQAVTILEKHLEPGDVDLATFLNNLGRGYELIGDFRHAENSLRKALALRERSSQQAAIARSCVNLAELYTVMRHYLQAAPLYERALRIHETLDPQDFEGLAACLNALGVLENRTGKLDDASAHLDRALTIWTEQRGPDDPNTLSVSSNLAVLYGKLGRLQDAEQRHRDTLARRRSWLGDHHPDIAISLYNLGINRLRQGFPREAFDLLSEATTIDDTILIQVLSTASEPQVLDHLASVAARTNAFLSLVSVHLASAPYAVVAAYELVLRRKAISIEVLRAQRAISARGGPEVRARQGRLRELRGRIRLTAMAETGIDADSHETNLRELEAERDGLERDLTRMIPELNVALRVTETNVNAVARALPSRSLLIELVHVQSNSVNPGSGRYLAFVLSAKAKKKVEMFDLGDARAIDKLVHEFRDETTEDHVIGTGARVHSKPSHSSAGKALSVLLLGRLRRRLDSAKRLLISPDGELARIPFQALPLGKSLVIDRLQVSYLSCARDLAHGASESVSTGRSLVVADPDFDLGSTARLRRKHQTQFRRSRSWRSAEAFTRLSGTRVEGRKTAVLLNVRPLMGRRALKGIVKQASRPTVMHLATHGFFFPDQTVLDKETGDQSTHVGRLARLESGRVENPLLRSGLALAGANAWDRGVALPEPAEDGILTAEDVSSLDLHGTELVVLSACETGLGSARFGAGVLGLRRAFAVAGARTLVMSLWRVPDDYTQRLMTTFYQQLLAGLDPAAALRNAQLQVRRMQSHPYYWAAFICEGNVAPLSFISAGNRDLPAAIGSGLC